MDTALRNYIKDHLTIKVFLATVMVLLALSAAIYGMVAFGMSKTYLSELNRSIEEEMNSMIAQFKEMPDEGVKNMLSRFAVEYGVSINLQDEDGNEIETYGDISYSLAPDVDSQKVQDSRGITKTYTAESKEGTVFRLSVFGSREQTYIGLNVLKRIFPVLAGITFVVSLIIAVFFSRYITRPILKVNEASKRMVKLDFQKPYPETRSDEIGILGENLNYLAECLEETLEELKGKNHILQEEIEREREMEKKQLAFFSAVSHELKTPITVLKGQLQGMIVGIGGYKDRDKYLKRSYEVTVSMEGMIQEILDVSRIKSNGFSLSRKEVQLGQLVEELTLEWEDIATDKGLKVYKELEERSYIYVDRSLFIKVASNLIGNAVKYTPSGGHIWIRVYRSNEQIVFSVENNAEHIPEEEIPKLFDPFYRRERSRNRKAGGSGLGLYIVKMIVELHGFQYEFSNTEQGVQIKIVCD
mgnify:FL=1